MRETDMDYLTYLNATVPYTGGANVQGVIVMTLFTLLTMLVVVQEINNRRK